jgi:hypothetical protein
LKETGAAAAERNKSGYGCEDNGAVAERSRKAAAKRNRQSG